MNYSQYKVIEFRRKFWKLFGADISILDPASNQLIGFIHQRAFRLKTDIQVYTDKTKQQSIVRIGGRQILSFKPQYGVFDSASGQELVSLRFGALKSYLVRWHIDILDTAGNPYAYVQETSSSLAIMRRWIGAFLGDLGELPFLFVPQTFDLMYAPNGAAPQLAGHITHRKNPLIVKMSLDTTQAQVALDPRITIAACSLMCIVDANKNA